MQTTIFGSIETSCARQIRDFDANAASLLGPKDEMGFCSPQPIRGQPAPPVLAGHGMDRTAKLPEDGSVSGAWATVFVQDVQLGLEPHVKPGEIKQIAVVQEIEKSTPTPQHNQAPDGPGIGRDYPQRPPRQERQAASQRAGRRPSSRVSRMDLDIPCYGTSSLNHKARLGSRRMMPLYLDATLAEVASRRCAECHSGGIPRRFYTRIMNPE